MVERSQQDFPAALRWFQQAMLILDAVDPNGFVTSSALTDLGNCEMFLGMLDDARNHTLRALRIREPLSAGLPQLFACISNLGIIELFAENLDAAEDYFERAVEIQEGLDDDPVKLAEALINLGNVLVYRWRFDIAREHYERALALLESTAPTNDALGKAILGNLRELTFRQGDFDAAESYSKREIAFFDQYYLDSVELGVALTGAGNIAQVGGDARGAKECYARALEIRERKTPNSSFVSVSLLFLGTAYMDLGELDEAETELRRGLEIAGGNAATGQEAAQILPSGSSPSREAARASRSLEKVSFSVTAWSPDGAFLVGDTQEAGTGFDLAYVAVADPSKVVHITSSRFDEREASLSPDGRWVAYQSDETGREEVFVTDFPAAARKWQLSRTGGRFPTWRNDGRELYFADPAGVSAVPVAERNGTLEPGAPERLPFSPEDFGFGSTGESGRFGLAVRSQDGKRYLVGRRSAHGQMC